MIKHGPCDMTLINKIYPEYTICEILRRIYRMTEDPAAQMLIRTAVTMAKAMSNKLDKLNSEWQKDFWDRA